MSESIERERLGIKRSLTMGAARNPIEAPAWLKTEKETGGELLSLVAALGLRSRFDRLAAPAKLESLDVVHDPERMLDAASRAILRRLYRAKKQAPDEAVTLRVLDALAERGLCLHPFDYRSLQVMMTVDEGRLDRNAQAWLQRGRSDDEVVAVPDYIDADNWTELPPAARVEFLRALRATDPARARELCEEAIPNDTAAVRGKLVQTMFTGLSADDVEFLESVATDRAKSVQKIATALLARIEGTDEHRERLDNAHLMLSVKGGGVIGRRKILQPQIPKGTAKGKIDEWMSITFGDVNPMQVAKALKLKPKQFADALGDPTLRVLFFIGALDAGEFEMATLIAAEFDTGDVHSLLRRYKAHLAALDSERREQFWACIRKPLDAADLVQGTFTIARLYSVLRTPPPADVLEAMAVPRRWKKWVKAATEEDDPAHAGVAELLISLCPGEQRKAWRERIAALPLAVTSNATALADLFDAIDAHQPTSS